MTTTKSSNAVRRPPWLTLAGVALTFPMLGCAVDMDRAFVQPGAYDYYNCVQLAAQKAAMTQQEKMLLQRKEKAAVGPDGKVIEFLVYEPDIRVARASLRLIEKTAAEKKCEDTSTPSEKPKPPRKPKP